MKKGICILLSLFVLLFTAGCGNKDDGNGVENILPQTDGQKGQSTDYEQGGSGTEIQESSEAVSEPEQEPDMETKTLVVYFSATGTTRPLAEYAAEILNADLYEIVPEDPYTEADLAYYMNGRADQEQNDSSGKTIIPFCTSHSSGIGSSADNLHVLCSDSVNWIEGRRFEAWTSRETMEEWLNDITN